MKNFISLILTLFLLTACQATYAPQNNSTPATNTPSISSTKKASTSTPFVAPSPTIPLHLQVPGENLKGVEVHFWHPWMGETTHGLQKIIDEFNQTNVWGIHAILENPGGPAQLNEQMQKALLDNKPPQLVAAPIDQLVNWQNQHPFVINLNDYIQDPQWGLSSEDIADFPDNVWARDVVDGRRLGIPAQVIPQLMIYNQTWAQELGFNNPPKTPQEFMDQACAAAKANLQDKDGKNNGTGGWIINTDSLAILSWMPAFGVSDLSGVGDANFSFQFNEMNSLFLYLRTLMDKNCAWTSRNPSPYEYLANRMALFYSGSPDDVLNQQRTMTRLESTDQWIVLPFPGPKGEDVSIANGPSYAILAASPEEQLASWLLIRWLALPRNQAAFVKSEASWPVSQKSVDLLSDYRATHPQWDASLAYIKHAQQPPISGDWVITRAILQDAAWQLFQNNITVSQIPDILNQLDLTIHDVLRNTP